MKISVIGLGWFGEPLALELIKEGHAVSGTTRSLEKMIRQKEFGIDSTLLSYPSLPSNALLSQDTIIFNIPPFEGALEWIKSWPWDFSKWIVFISSVSVLREQEDWVKNNFQEWTILRFGGLIGGERHPGRHLSGKKNLSGRLWPVNLIRREDCIGVTKVVLEKNLKQEIFDIVSDEHPTRESFYSEYCLKKKFPLPEFDQEDNSTKESISNEKIKEYYSGFLSIKD